MQYLYLGLLCVCLLGIQDTAAAFFNKTSKLPPNRLWLNFNHNGETASVKLRLARLRELARKDLAQAEKIQHYIEMLPHTSNPLLVLVLLHYSAVKASMAISKYDDNYLLNLDGDLTRQASAAQVVAHDTQRVYYVVKNDLFKNSKLLEIFSVTDDERDLKGGGWLIPHIDGWKENKKPTVMLEQHLPELVSSDGIALQDIEQLMTVIKEKLIALDQTAAASIFQTEASMLEDENRFMTNIRAENHSEAYYMQAVAEYMLHTDGLTDDKETQLNYLASALMKVSSVYTTHTLIHENINDNRALEVSW